MSSIPLMNSVFQPTFYLWEYVQLNQKEDKYNQKISISIFYSNITPFFSVLDLNQYTTHQKNMQ